LNKSEIMHQAVGVLKKPDTNLGEKPGKLLILAENLLNQGRFDQALNALNQCALLDPENPEIYLVRAAVYQKMDRPQLALADLNSTLDLSPGDTHTYIQRGEIYRLLNRPYEALNDLNQAVKLAPHNPLALGDRGIIYQNLKKFEEALADYNHAIESDPANAGLYGKRAETYRSLKDYPRAISDYNQVLKLNPAASWVYERRSYPLLWVDDLEKAQSDFKAAWNANRANLMNGWMAEWTGMCQPTFSFSPEARDRLKALAASNPNNYAAFLCRASLYWWLHVALKESYRQAELACNLLPDQPEAYFWKGLAAAGLKEEEEAVFLLQRALDLGLPLALLAPLAWINKVNPVFYNKYGVNLLTKNKLQEPQRDPGLETANDFVKSALSYLQLQDPTEKLKPVVPIKSSPDNTVKLAGVTESAATKPRPENLTVEVEPAQIKEPSPLVGSMPLKTNKVNKNNPTSRAKKGSFLLLAFLGVGGLMASGLTASRMYEQNPAQSPLDNPLPIQRGVNPVITPTGLALQAQSTITSSPVYSTTGQPGSLVNTMQAGSDFSQPPASTGLIRTEPDTAGQTEPGQSPGNSLDQPGTTSQPGAATSPVKPATTNSGGELSATPTPQFQNVNGVARISPNSTATPRDTSTARPSATPTAEGPVNLIGPEPTSVPAIQTEPISEPATTLPPGANPGSTTTAPTQVPTDAVAPTAQVVPTSAPVPTSTPVPNEGPTSTPIPTGTPIPTEIPTSTPVPTEVPTSTPVPTEIPTSTPVPTIVPTSTPLPAPTPTIVPTNTPVPTAVPTQVPTNTPPPTKPPKPTKKR
jgi:tetratricopeptide (TPR) repeat protein